MKDSKVGSVLVVGGGIAGMQSAIDLAEAGFKVYLVEEGPSIGGRMAQLDKTFPADDCAMCTLAPRMVDIGRHPNIEVLTYSQVVAVGGEPGRFEVTVRKRARSIDPEKCTGCGECTRHCPVRYRAYFPALETAEPELVREDIARVDRILGRYIDRRSPLIPVLQAINAEFNYLPEPILHYISRRLDIPLAHILRVATFYALFSLKPRGRHVISVCQGTSCFVRGGDRVLERFKEVLGIEVGEVTPDRQFSLEVVRCLGCCALAPAIKVGETVHAGVNPREVEDVVRGYVLKG